jgi:23S rRNA (cytosine1962-C5)-methyltransferase
MKRVVLKKGKERAIANRHPWIFSGAIHSIDDDIPDGSIAPIADFGGTIIAWGYVNRASDITVRILSFGEKAYNIDQLRFAVKTAIQKRKGDPFLASTNACRLIHSEGDNLPGLIVDSYDGHLVLQSLALGIDCLRDDIVQILAEELKPTSIYERSDHAGRNAEGIEKRNGTLLGHALDEIVIFENGMKCVVDIKHGQKTGFFLDQRANRIVARTVAGSKRVLNLFSYTGAFTIAAHLGGAQEVVSVDSSRSAMEMLQKNLLLNEISSQSIGVCDDAFDYLRRIDEPFDFIIVDPPAFVKSRGDVADGVRGYRELHLQALKRCSKNAYLLTCSCSRFITMDDFQKILFSAAAKIGRHVSILGKYHQPSDHPVNIFAPETEYLKSMLLYVT